jgi:peptidoglycan hydrolase-like protein with peptidoglycan-binding domain
MSTQYYTEPATSQSGTTHRSPRRGNQGSGYRIVAIVIGGIVAAALIVLATVGLTHDHSTAATPAPAASTSAPASPSTPAAIPSAAVKTLQAQLGQLNYYEGPVDGLMGPQTVAAIQDLQRQAGLPQTGTMNAATTTALNNYLAHGDNQMAG